MRKILSMIGAGNRDALNLIPSARIVRWDTLLADPRHVPALERPEALYKADGEFTRALDATVADFWQRNAERLGGMQRGRFDASSRAFLLEELGVFSFSALTLLLMPMPAPGWRRS